MKELDQHTETPPSVTLYADILLPVPIPQYYTYRVPNAWSSEVATGKRVIVQFGPRKILTGIVVSVHDIPPSTHQAKYILDILDHKPVVNSIQLNLFRWIADYYMSTEGQVLQVALPSGLKLSSQSRIQLHPEFNQERCPYPLDDRELLLLKALEEQSTIDYGVATEILGTKNLHKIIKSLLTKKAILLFEEVKEKFHPKKERRVRLTEDLISAEALESQFESLKKKSKQTEVLLKYLQHVQVLNNPEINIQGYSKSDLLASGISASSLKTLIKNRVMEEFEVVVSRFPATETNVGNEQKVVLTAYQKEARNRILSNFEKKDTVLFHGITGSGKTEIYIDVIQQVLNNGLQVLYLLPEIALTTQIVNRLRKIFGNSMGVYHSRFSDNERVEVWRGILEGKFSLIVGVRSAVFLPFDNLGLIIVDEEHEPSYKQFDPSPRYHARDVALVLARMHHAKTLLGSATPAIESFYHVQNGKYQLVNLDHRYQKVALPVYKLVDIARARLKKQMKGLFSSELINQLQDSLEQGQQAIIFQNRRGYAPYLRCQTCNHTPQCPNCAVTLTYHLHYNQLRCHYCGYKQKMTDSCAQCDSRDVQLIGYGTEKIEEELRKIFPSARIQRMDLDTTRRKYSYQQIIDQFENGDIDILIGTQMVSKGLDFGKVDLVGVLDIDRMLHFPDFRSYERAFQLITQVGGRAGRRSGKGLVLVQTSNPQHQLLKIICDHNYGEFYGNEIREREKYHYPPFTRLIRLVVKSNDQDQVYRASQELAGRLVHGLGKHRVLGPQEPVIAKLRNLYLMELYIKLEKGKGVIEKIKQHLSQQIIQVNNMAEYRSVRIIPDVDPY